MKICLIHKFFASFLLTALIIVVLLIAAVQFFIYRNFSEYVSRVELEKLNHLTRRLEKEYQIHGGWNHLLYHPPLWHDILRRNLSKDHNIRLEGKGKAWPAPLPVDTLQIGKRLALFDAEKRFIAGNRSHNAPCMFRQIVLNDQIVGWLGLRMVDNFYHPLDITYIKGQNTAFYLTGTAILVFALAISFLLSKHLLEPVRRLTEGTKALAAFKFDIKIKVCTNDELGQLASDFNQMAETLKKYEEMRAQWITDISHELRTPLSVLRGEIEAMQDGIREINRATLDSLHSEVLRLTKLVDDLHQLSLADTQDLQMKKEAVFPLMVLSDIVGLFQNRFDERKIEIRMGLNPSDAVTLSGDENRLAQLFVNLMENTLRYTDSPGVLNIQSELKAGRLILCFEDSKPGVPDHACERIFDRLYRVDKSRSRELGGSGLGLSICRHIVESHGGTIRADRGALGGLRITMAFPRQEAENTPSK